MLIKNDFYQEKEEADSIEISEYRKESKGVCE